MRAVTPRPAPLLISAAVAALLALENTAWGFVVPTRLGPALLPPPPPGGDRRRADDSIPAPSESSGASIAATSARYRRSHGGQRRRRRRRRTARLASADDGGGVVAEEEVVVEGAAAALSRRSGEVASDAASAVASGKQTFDLATALFCGGLAFDAYAEPPKNSSRWERGSQGLNVAFLSAAYTRSLYKGLIEVTPIQCSDLPDEDDTAEGLLTGGGTDAALLVAVAEGKWKEDVKKMEKEQYHNGVFDLVGSAHVGRSSTAWSNVNENKAKANQKKGGSGAYHIPSTWGKGGTAVWKDDPPFYLYVQEPAEARLVFTVLDDDVVGSGDPIGSAHRKLANLIPAAKEDDPVKMLKEAVLAKMKQGDGSESAFVDAESVAQAVSEAYKEWEGDIKLTSKPKKKDKGGQVAMAAAAGAMMAGPAGAALGGFMGSMYEGQVRGKMKVKLRYTPIPNLDVKREKYEVKGGLPGVSWGELYERHVQKIRENNSPDAPDPHLVGDDLEFCCFVNHDETGCSCAIYRSLEKRLIAISFRGTCEPVDLVTDASIAQEAWVEGEDIEKEDTAKVHIGFRKSLNSISRRLKELVLAAVAPGEDLSQYDVLVTGHSLGGALATLFTADIAEYGMDAGRGLPQMEESEPWWNSLASSFLGKSDEAMFQSPPPPPRPRTLRMYNFGSPRVGNDAFCAKFDSFQGNGIDEMYRIVNDQDVVARFPRTVNALAFGSIGYEHCGPTVLISEIKQLLEKAEQEGTENNLFDPSQILWIEGESDDKACPVRDGQSRTSPLASGSLLGDIVSAVKSATSDSDESKDSTFNLSKLGSVAEQVTGRLQNMSVEDLSTIVGIDQKFTQRELKLISSIVSGEGLSHHMEDRYYQGMGMSVGYIAMVGQELKPIESMRQQLDGVDVLEMEEILLGMESSSATD